MLIRATKVSHRGAVCDDFVAICCYRCWWWSVAMVVSADTMEHLAHILTQLTAWRWFCSVLLFLTFMLHGCISFRSCLCNCELSYKRRYRRRMNLSLFNVDIRSSHWHLKEKFILLHMELAQTLPLYFLSMHLMM